MSRKRNLQDSNTATPAGPLCRVCLQCCQFYTSLFSSLRKHPIYKHINNIVDVKIKKCDGYPDVICQPCLKDLLVIIDFKERCLKSYSSLKETPKICTIQNIFCKEEDEKIETIEVKLEDSLIKNEALIQGFDDGLVGHFEGHDNVESLCDSKEIYFPGVSDQGDGESLCETQANNLPDASQESTERDVENNLPPAKLLKHESQPSQHNTCHLCGNSFKSLLLYQKHMQEIKKKACLDTEKISVTGVGVSRIFYCKQCNYSSKRHGNIKSHLETHTDARIHICRICNKSYRMLTALLHHKRLVHNSNKNKQNCTVCNHCGRIFKSLFSYEKHKKDIEKKPCLDTEQITVTGAGTARVFQCKQCNYKTSNHGKVKSHLETHSTTRTHICEICNKTYNLFTSLLHHKRLVHGPRQVQLYTCHVCGKQVKSKSTLNNHLMLHDENSKVQCPYCKKLYNSAGGLSQHLKRHTGPKGYQCDICQKSFYTKAEISGHMKIKHLTKKRFSCRFCGFRAKFTLARHEMGHTDSNVACEICGSFFDNESKLKAHTIQIHETEKRFACSICGHLSHTRRNMHKHKAKHHKVKVTFEN